jgi:2-polyprenyl-3-methyl-5-hydroxy-6-metoxy-1,4-benzoquinol methylase
LFVPALHVDIEFDKLAIGIIYLEPRKKSMKKNAYAEMYAVEHSHWWYVGLHSLVLLLIKKFYSQQKLKILDAGCGTGGLLSILKQAGHDVAGLDFSDDAVFFCHERGLADVIKADINDWTPGANSYDVIISMDVLCHEWVHDETKVLRSFIKGLNQNGLVMLNYPAFPALSRHHDEVVMIRERYTKKSLAPILENAGLTPVLISYRLAHAYLILTFLHFWGSKKKNGPEKSDIAVIPPRMINHVLIAINKFENWLIAQGCSIPFGSSLFVVAKKANA